MKNRLTEIIACSRRRGPVYIVSEDFEGTGAPSGWTFNGTGTCNYDATGGPSGQHLFVASTTNSNLGGAQYSLPGGSRSVFGFYCRMHLNFIGFGINRSIWVMDDAYLLFSTGSGVYWLGSQLVTLPRYTWFHVWIDFAASSRSFFFSLDAIKPSTPTATVASGGSCSRLAISINHSVGVSVDSIRVAASPIGSNPI